MKKIVALVTALLMASSVACAEQTRDTHRSQTVETVAQSGPIVVKNQKDLLYSKVFIVK